MPAVTKTGVSKVRKELFDILEKYRLISDALAGEKEIKEAGEKYLPIPSEASNCETLKKERYKAYLTRAVYYNVIKPTRDALVGQLFLRPPKVTLPPRMEMMANDVNGEGLGIEQLIRRAANHVLPYGRCGFLADFPKTNGEVTATDIENGVRPVIKFYEPWAIINWRVEKRGNSKKLVLLVLQEIVEVPTQGNEFDMDLENMYRVYRLSPEGQVTVELWEENKNEVVKGETHVVRDSSGESLTEIPFEFIGSENNDAEIDEPPLYSMATLNIAHFRNSADYEESVFLVGQPTPVYSGLTEDWAENYFKGGVPFGSRASVPLPEGASAQLLQAEPNTLAFEAMTHKEEQMIAIGAKIINPRQTVERKEAEIQIEAASQRSVLTTIKENLQMGFLACLKKAASFVGESPDNIELELNDNFDLTSMSAEELRWLIELFKANLLEFDAVHENLRRSGIVKNTPEQSKTLILGDLEFRKKMMVLEEKKEPNNLNPAKPEAKAE